MAGVVLIVFSSVGNKANEVKHAQERDTDKQQIAGLNQAIETQIQNNERQYLRHQQELLALRDQVTDLKKDVATQELRKKMAILQARIDKTLTPRPLAKLQSGFLQTLGTENEIVDEIYAPVDGSVVTFDFTLLNQSKVFAKSVLLWLRICTACKFHKEPAGAQLVPGALPSERLYSGIYLPPGVEWQKMTVEIEVPPAPTGRVEIGTRYRCEECEIEEDYHKMGILLGRVPVPNFTPPQPSKKPKKPKKP